MATLSKQILFGDDAQVAEFIRQGAKLDEIDEYGYTPLIQTAIANSLPKAKILLDAGANVNFSDLTGRTALHWAADNNSHDLAELLIANGADCNAATLAGQPVLAMPHLRDQRKMKRILYEGGADLTFAKDFINAKLLGHRFELEGRVDIVNHDNRFLEVEFEGFFLEFSLAIVARSLRDFKNNFGGKHMRPYFDLLDSIIHGLNNAAHLLKFQHYLIDEKRHQSQIDKLLRQVPLIVPVSFTGHAICLIRLGDWLVRCDRGEYGVQHGTVIFYQMEKPEAFSGYLLKQILYKRQDKDFINHQLPELLGLKPFYRLPLPTQLTGNCAWANVEAVVPAMMYLLLLSVERKKAVADISECEKKALFFHDQWLRWEKDRALHFCIQSFRGVTPARQASRAAMLAAILFQCLEYDNEDDSALAEKILPILFHEKFNYILKAYVKVFWNERNSPMMKNLARFIEEFGVHIEDFYQAG